MRGGFVALTDPDWYAFLERQESLDEVNFWRPHGRPAFRALQPGDPFFFKLLAPDKAIVGFGFFARYERLPAWLAWECFGRANGAPDFPSMVNLLLRRRKEAPTAAARRGDFSIGCILIAAPIFFPRSHWVDPPTDWPATGVQVGKGVPLHFGEGARVLQECLTRAQTLDRYWNVEPIDPSPPETVREQPRFGRPIPVRPRLGQGQFRLEVRHAYGNACAITREHSDPVLEAAHIRPYSQGGEHRIQNGILLRRDLHRLFDRGYVTITPDYEFRVGSSLREEFHNGRSYYGLDRTQIALPANEALHPDRELLDWHRQTLFRG